MADRIDTLVHPQQSTRPHPLRDPIGAEAKGHQLPPGDNAPLALRDPL
jgi:hypothetical protein